MTVISSAGEPGAIEVGPPPPFDPELVPALEAVAATRGPEFTLENIQLIREARSVFPQPTDDDLRRGGAFELSTELVPGPAGAPEVPLLICRP
ncbi:MAG: alpha/beta hydrolase, partial [Trebonia sp.]